MRETELKNGLSICLHCTTEQRKKEEEEYPYIPYHNLDIRTEKEDLGE